MACRRFERCPTSHARGRRGVTLIYTVLVMVPLFGVLGLCVDYGQRRMVAGELQAAADAAAIAGAQRIGEACPTDPADVQTRAAAIGNASGGAAVGMLASDVELGRWDDDARTFDPACVPDDVNAVRATATRSAARGNAIPTTLARAVGVGAMDVSRTSIARIERPPRYALIGLDAFAARGLLTVDGSPCVREGNIASNGDVELNLLGLVGVTLVDGHIATFGTVRLPALGATIIRDGTRRPPRRFTLPAVSLAIVTTRNDNAQLGGFISAGGDVVVAFSAHVPAGTYCCRNLTVLAGVILQCDGPVTIFVGGDVAILGTVLAFGGDAATLKVRVAGTGQVTIGANVTLSADVYAPNEPITVAAGVIYRGRLIGRRIDVIGTSFFFLRPDLADPELGRSRVAITR